MDIFVSAIFAYLIGSIPFGLILTRMAGLGDIRKIGSGNIGATNVLRTGRKWLALATLVLDFGKSYAPATLAAMYAPYAFTNPEPEKWLLPQGLLFFVLPPLFVVLGHMFPIWLKFKGGKGVACLFGLCFALSPITGLCASIGWLAAFFSTRFSSIGALVGLPLGVLASLAWVDLPMLLPLLLPLLLMIAKHRDNIPRLLKGEESRFSFKANKTVIVRTEL